MSNSEGHASSKVEGRARKYLVTGKPGVSTELAGEVHGDPTERARRERVENAFLAVSEPGGASEDHGDAAKKTESTGKAAHGCPASKTCSEVSGERNGPPKAAKCPDPVVKPNRRAGNQRRSGLCDITDPHFEKRQTVARVFKKRF